MVTEYKIAHIKSNRSFLDEKLTFNNPITSKLSVGNKETDTLQKLFHNVTLTLWSQFTNLSPTIIHKIFDTNSSFHVK